ncbi:putative potassium transporter [Cladophialophora carrionii]|uniref:Potassium transport protein n=1 Tax=Cladophialophora carrionii TaxID=86049 RepID=A0A1C1C785_9EURO|nr:putative potassium transporter [Cladophialophora carrionii]
MEKPSSSLPAGPERRKRQTVGQRAVAWVRHHVYQGVAGLSFIQWHYFYFVASTLVASLIFWGSSTPAKSVPYIDSLFLCVSAMTEAGLNTVNLSELNTWQQILLFLLIIFGSAIFVSSSILHIRKRAFESKFAELVEQRRKRQHRPRTRAFTLSRRDQVHSNGRESTVASGALRGRLVEAGPECPEYKDASCLSDRSQALEAPAETQAGLGPPHVTGTTTDDSHMGHIRFAESVPPVERTESRSRSMRHSPSFFEGRGVGARGLDNHPRNARPVEIHDATLDCAIDDKSAQPGPWVKKVHSYIDTAGGYLGRNSQFHHLSEKERRKLGGIEYDAICLLSWLVPVYFALFQLFGVLGVGAWITANRPHISSTNGLNPFWTGAFFAVSAFNNSGMALLDANAVALNTSYYCMLTLSLLILAGNTLFPPFLRLILWSFSKVMPENSASAEWARRRRTVQFCLDHPRRVYTNLFPSAATWWLVASVVVLNAVDWAAFELLNIGNEVVDSLPTGFRIVAGLFQAFAVRSGGFYIVSISGLRSGLLVLYVLMMYLSAFPVTMTIRNTNVYEERSLGIFADELPLYQDNEGITSQKDKKEGLLTGLRRTLTMTHGGHATQNPTWSREDFIRLQLRSQLGHDLWWIAVAVFAITSIETGQFERDPVNFSTFNIIFEVISAYGCVGISVGVPWNNYSFCGAWHLTSKLVLCAVMLRGRHRGLPVSIDRAILLPDESLAWAEEEDAHKRTTSFTSEVAMRSGEVLRPATSATASTNAARRPRSASSGAPGPSIHVDDHARGAEHVV